MCSYFAPNGISSCGNEYLLNDRIRSAWKRPDAVVMSDCSAVGNMMKNVMKLDQQHASAQAMNAGLDIYGAPTFAACIQLSMCSGWHPVIYGLCHNLI
jgi:beta-glucosidase-like glycosyl hydrolase